MRRHHVSSSRNQQSDDDDDEEDVFAAFSKKKKKKSNTKKQKAKLKSDTTTTSAADKDEQKKIATTTSKGTSTPSTAASSSSHKRHHGTSQSREDKMNALLLELEESATSQKQQQLDHNQQNPNDANQNYYEQYLRPNNQSAGDRSRGSFVEEGEEHLTTNIFVGNLAPSVTEEALTDLFRQFGDLYSVKIMWPRTPEERARNRNTGFVCFMLREDAQEAMDTFNEEDPFHNGRRIILRWSKNVKKTVKRGTGGVKIIKKKAIMQQPLASSSLLPNDYDRIKTSQAQQHQKKSQNELSGGQDKQQQQGIIHSKMSKEPTYPPFDPYKHSDPIRVKLPSDPFRIRYITTVASFVAKDGSILEKKLVEKAHFNPSLSFLLPQSSSSILAEEQDGKEEEEEKENERVFYRWRVFAFTQGDGFDSWNTTPFLMFRNTQPDPKKNNDEKNCRYWIPPPLLNQEAARREDELSELFERDLQTKMERRRQLNKVSVGMMNNADSGDQSSERESITTTDKKNDDTRYMTGRQLEHAKYSGQGKIAGIDNERNVQLNDWEREMFDILTRQKLCASRQSICEAMAFCFDKSGAAKQVSSLLKDLMLEDDSKRNISVDTRIARLFLISDVLFNSQQPGVRNAFRYRDAIEQMSSEVFRFYGSQKYGRMTMNKLTCAVHGVLDAWMSWSVYNNIFIEDLKAFYEGKTPPSEQRKQKQKEKEKQMLLQQQKEKELESNKRKQDDVENISSSAGKDTSKRPKVEWKPVQQDNAVQMQENPSMNHDGGDLDGDDLDSEDLDGDDLDDEDLDGEDLDENELMTPKKPLQEQEVGTKSITITISDPPNTKETVDEENDLDGELFSDSDDENSKCKDGRRIAMTENDTDAVDGDPLSDNDDIS